MSHAILPVYSKGEKKEKTYVKGYRSVLKTQASTHFTAGEIQTDYQSDQFVTTESAVVLNI